MHVFNNIPKNPTRNPQHHKTIAFNIEGTRKGCLPYCDRGKMFKLFCTSSVVRMQIVI